MKTLRLCVMASVFAIWATAFGELAVPQQKFATVTIHVLDSFGHAQSDCRVREFVSLDSEPNTDYADHFNLLKGQNIPYGLTYRVYVRCSDKRSGGTFVVAVQRPNQFLILASWLNIGDYVTGPDPRLTISVKSEEELSSGAWIKLDGVYVNKHEIDRIEPDTRTARFYEPVPGRYFILLVTNDGVACAKQFDFLKAPAKLELSVSRKACLIETGLSANVRE